MKIIKHFIFALTLSPTLLFAQNNDTKNDLDKNQQVVIDQQLSDFNDKYHTLFVASYNGFEGTTVDFEKGLDENISEENAKKVFHVSYSSDKDKLVAIALQQEIANRIITVSPKGFVQTKESLKSKEVITISFDPQYGEKGAYQPTITIVLNYKTQTVQVNITEPVKD